MTDVDVLESLSTVQIVALTLYGETRGEPIESKVAVGNVIRNRVTAGRFGDGYAAVCLKPWQFSCWKPEGGAANHQTVMSAARSFVRGETIPPILRECEWVATGIISGALRDNTHGADHYLTTELLYTKPPGWAKEEPPIAVIGAHTFFHLA